MKRVSLITCSIILLSNLQLQAQKKCDVQTFSAPLGIDITCPQDDWIMVFEDDFEGDELDLSKWNTESSNGAPLDRAAPASGAVAIPENVSVYDSRAVLT